MNGYISLACSVPVNLIVIPTSLITHGYFQIKNPSRVLLEDVLINYGNETK